MLVGVGRRVAELRVAHGWTQEMFAERLGYDVTHLSKIERGKLGLNVTTLVRLANGLGCASVRELFEDPVSQEAPRVRLNRRPPPAA